MYSVKNKANNKNFMFIPIIFLLFNMNLFTKDNIKDITKETVIKVGNENITYQELQRAFQKNMNRKNDKLFNVNKDSLNKFVGLYSNYKLKVLDAIDKKYNEDESVIKEFNSQRKLLAESFLFEKNVLDKNIETYLKRRENEVQMAIILINFDMTNPNADKEIFRQKAREAITKLKSGEKFEDVCKEYCLDEELKNNGGFIKTFITSCDKIQRPIEEALYSIKPGEYYPDIIETNFGIVIVKLMSYEKRKFVKAKHILISKLNELDDERINRKADSLLKLIKSGKSFERMAEENSDDIQSAIYGGYLGELYSRSTGMQTSTNKLNDDFVEALFNLKDNEVSQKVKTEFGIHIIKRDSTFDIPKEYDLDDISKKYKRLYYDEDKQKFLDKLSKELNFKIDELNFNKLLSKLDTTKTNLDPSFAKLKEDDIKSYVIISNKDKKWTIEELIDFSLKNENRLKGTATNKEGLNKSIKKMIEGEIIEISSKNLENEFEEFRSLSRDFFEGILLFKVENENVWEKLKFDTLIARKYYDSTKTNYFSDKMYDVSEIFVMNDSIANEIYNKANKGENFAQLASEYTLRPGLREKNGELGLLSAKRSKYAQILNQKNYTQNEIMNPITFENGYVILKINSVVEPKQKTFEEAINDISSEVQNIVRQNLLNQWLSGVRNKHKVEVDWDKLEIINKTLSAKSK